MTDERKPSVQPIEKDGAVSEIERMWSLGEWTAEDNESFMRAIEIIRKHCPVVQMTPEEKEKFDSLREDVATGWGISPSEATFLFDYIDRLTGGTSK